MKNSNNKKMSPKKVTKVQKSKSKNLGSLKKRGKEDTKKSPLLRGAKKTSTSEKGMKKSVSSDRAFNYNYIRTKTFDLENYISTIDEGSYEERLRMTPSSIEGGGTCSLYEINLFVGNIVLDAFISEQSSINIDAMNSALLLFCPPAALNKSCLTYASEMGVKEMKRFRTLVVEGLGHVCFGPRQGGARGPHHRLVRGWMLALPTSYGAQVALLAHLLGYISRVSGLSVRSLGVAPGQTIGVAPGDTMHALADVERLADAMALKNNWGKGAPVLRTLYGNLKAMVYSFAHGRDGQTGQFGPAALH